MNRRKIKIYFIFYVIFLSTFIMFHPRFIGIVNAEDDDVTYVTTGEIIKNYKVESFNDQPMKDNSYAGGKLKVETEPVWRVTKDDIQVISTNTIGNRTYIYYKVGLRNTINILTNVRLNDAGSLTPKTTDYTCLHYKRYWWEIYCKQKVLGVCVTSGTRWVKSKDSKYKAEFHHYDFFDDVRAYNQPRNSFEGPLRFSFDIDDSPLPDLYTAENGDKLYKKFDYISLSSIIVEDSVNGKLSEDTPEFVTTDPSDFDDDIERSAIGGDVGKEKGEKYFNFGVSLSEPTLFNTMDLGVLPMTPGASMRPTTKNGEALWDPKDQEKSTENATFTYDLNSLSPVIFEYRATMSYNSYDVKHRLGGGLVSTSWEGLSPSGNTVTKQVGLHVQNRYIQADLLAVFTIWTCFEIDIANNNIENKNLELPQEYYDNLTWGSFVDGAQGVQYSYEKKGLLEELFDTLFGDLFGSDLSAIIGIVVMIIVILIVLGIGIFIIKRAASPMGIMKRQMKQQQKMQQQMVQMQMMGQMRPQFQGQQPIYPTGSTYQQPPTYQPFQQPPSQYPQQYPQQFQPQGQPQFQQQQPNINFNQQHDIRDRSIINKKKNKE